MSRICLRCLALDMHDEDDLQRLCCGRTSMKSRRFLTLVLNAFFLMFTVTIHAGAQDNYEIQVYGSDLVDPGHTMVELHSNFTVDGSKQVTDGVLPSNHAEHETLEITQGLNTWFETGFYVF